MTPYVERAKGAYLWDVDGKKYIDYRMAFGPIILGHSYDEVDQKVIEEIQKGILFAMTGELEVAVAEMNVEMAPAVEMVRLACSGTEATMHVIRVARAYTGRDLILKFEGNYHGFHDHTLWTTYSPVEAYGNRRSPIAVPSSSGIPNTYTPLQEAIERKLIGDLKNVVSLTIADKTRKDPKTVKRRQDALEALEQKGYCPVCAESWLQFVGDILRKEE